MSSQGQVTLNSSNKMTTWTRIFNSQMFQFTQGFGALNYSVWSCEVQTRGLPLCCNFLQIGGTTPRSFAPKNQHVTVWIVSGGIVPGHRSVCLLLKVTREIEIFRKFITEEKRTRGKHRREKKVNTPCGNRTHDLRCVRATCCRLHQRRETCWSGTKTSAKFLLLRKKKRRENILRKN